MTTRCGPGRDLDPLLARPPAGRSRRRSWPATRRRSAARPPRRRPLPRRRGRPAASSMGEPISACAVSTKWQTSPRIRPPCRAVVIPVPVRHRARRHPVDQQLRPAGLGQDPPRGQHGRRPAPVEADRELPSGPLPRSRHVVELVHGQRERLLAPHVPARPSGRAWPARRACRAGWRPRRPRCPGRRRRGTRPIPPGRSRSAPRRGAQLRPLAEAMAVNRSNPAARKAGSSVPVENEPAPTQPTPGRRRPTRRRVRRGTDDHRLVGGARRVGQLDRQVRLGGLLDELVRAWSAAPMS